MERAPVSDSFVPPPVQRLSRSFSALGTLGPCPLLGPNRPPPIPDHSTIFPRLHRLEIADDMASQKKLPLLILSLSSPSFLNAVATDTDTDKPLYSVETVGFSTTIWRSDPWDGSAKIADIRWPKDLPLKGKGRDAAQGATFQMDSLRWRETSTLLRPSSLGSSRKFHIPHHPHALKWKREGNVYSCTTPSCKGVVATLESFDSDTAPTLKVFETLGSFHQSLPRLDHAGISLSFLDYLFVTALLLVTEPEDWMVLDRNPATLDCRSSDSLKHALPSRASNRQWRKIMYGEPLYPSLKTPAFDKGAVNAGEDADVLDTSEPQSSASVRQWRKIVYGEPLYPSLRSQSVDGFDLPPRPSTATSFSSESAYSPPTPSSDPSSGPSTGFYDSASLFEETDDTTARSSIETTRVSSPLAPSSGTLSPMPSSECIPFSAFPVSTLSSARRELPSPPSSYQPPSPSVQPWLHRSNSSPKLRHGAQSPISSSADDQDDLSNGSLLTRMASNVRQLPTPPLRDFLVQSPQSHSRIILETRRLSQAHQRSLPPTPESIPRSPSATQQHHGHSFSQVVASQSLPPPRLVRPSTAQPGPSMATQNDVAEDGQRLRHEKDPGQVINWMRDITRAHRRRVFDDEEQFANPYDSIYDAPPAYNAIDFSTPPHARSPPEGTQRTDSL